MDVPGGEPPSRVCHVVATPYHGRGHINPMMNLCRQMAMRKPHHLLITFVVTQEWLALLDTDFKQKKLQNLRFVAIPNVLPSELSRGKDISAFIEAVIIKMEVPFAQLLDCLAPVSTAIVTDAALRWAIRAANRRNIPVAALRTSSVMVFSLVHHIELLIEKGKFFVDLSEHGEELIDYIPGVPPMKLADMPTTFRGNSPKFMKEILESNSYLPKTQFLLFNSVCELEASVLDDLKTKFRVPLYSLGPCIPYFEQKEYDSNLNYIHWLSLQPKSSVLYVSMGSFLSTSSAQMDEIVAGLCSSGVRFLLVARAEASRFMGSNGGLGLIVPRCDQLRVLCHSSGGRFWTHYGWNSTLEAAYAGVPMLTFPLFWDQVPNSKVIVEDWKVGWRVKREVGVDDQSLVTREDIAQLVGRFMDLENGDSMELRENARKLQGVVSRLSLMQILATKTLVG